MPDVLHAARDTWYCPTVDDVCEECGKPFKRTDDHAYTRYIGYKRRWYCSYTCFRVWEREQEAKAPKPEEEPDEDELSEIEKAQKRAEECARKIEEYIHKKRCASNRVERANAQDCITRWQRKLNEAKERIKDLQKGDLG